MYELADGHTITVDIAFGLIEFMGDVVAGTIMTACGSARSTATNRTAN